MGCCCWLLCRDWDSYSYCCALVSNPLFFSLHCIQKNCKDMSSASAPDATHSQQLVHNWVYIVFWSAVAGEERGNVIRVAPAAVVDSSTNNK